MASAKKFSVVLFTKDNSYAVVPSSWLILQNSQCFWPGKKTKNPTKLAEDGDSIPDSTFKKYNIQFVKSYETYQRADAKAKILRTSERIEIPESSDTDYTSSSRRHQVTTEVLQVGAPAGTIFEPEELLALNNASADEGTAVENQDINHDHQVFNLGDEPGQPGSVQWIADPNLLELKTKFEAFQIECFTKFEELRADIRHLKDLLHHVLNGLNPPQSTGQVIRSYPPIPLRSKEELIRTEAALTDQTQFDLMVGDLKRIGGPTIAKNVYNVLKHAIYHNLALEIRFTDKSGKLAFGETKLAAAVRAAVLSVPHEKSVDISTIDDLMKKWFRNSIDRQGGSRKKLTNGSTEANAQATNSSGGRSNFEENASSESDEPNM